MCKSIPQQTTRQRIAPASGRHVSMHTRRQLRNATDMLRSCLDATPHDDEMIVPGVLQLETVRASAMALHMQTSNQPSLQLHVTRCTQQRQPTSQASIHPSIPPSRSDIARSLASQCMHRDNVHGGCHRSLAMPLTPAINFSDQPYVTRNGAGRDLLLSKHG